jgi:hypothetical protein
MSENCSRVAAFRRARQCGIEPKQSAEERQRGLSAFNIKISSRSQAWEVDDTNPRSALINFLLGLYALSIAMLNYPSV